MEIGDRRTKTGAFGRSPAALSRRGRRLRQVSADEEVCKFLERVKAEVRNLHVLDRVGDVSNKSI